MTPQRIQLRRTRGWRKPEGAIVVARPSKWGNPYRVIGGTVYGPAGGPLRGGELVAYSTHSHANDAVLEAIQKFRRDIGCEARSKLTAELIRRKLAGHDLACWCPVGFPCHSDVLIALANEVAA